MKRLIIILFFSPLICFGQHLTFRQMPGLTDTLSKKYYRVSLLADSSGFVIHSITTHDTVRFTVTGILPIAKGGTGTATPSLIAGNNMSVTGAWPNQTVATSANLNLDSLIINAPGLGATTQRTRLRLINSTAASGGTTIQQAPALSFESRFNGATDDSLVWINYSNTNATTSASSLNWSSNVIQGGVTSTTFPMSISRGGALTVLNSANIGALTLDGSSALNSISTPQNNNSIRFVSSTTNNGSSDLNYFSIFPNYNLTGSAADIDFRVARFEGALGSGTHKIMWLGTASTATGGGTLTPLFVIDNKGKPYSAGTIIAGGTTGAQTINKPVGSVNFAAGAQTIVVTNSLATTVSLIFLSIMTDDTTAKSAVISALSAGSFTIKLNATATAETKVAFHIIDVQ